MQPGLHRREPAVTERDYATKLDELDRLLNDPEVPMEAARIWSLLAEMAAHTANNAHPAMTGNAETHANA